MFIVYQEIDFTLWYQDIALLNLNKFSCILKKSFIDTKKWNRVLCKKVLI